MIFAFKSLAQPSQLSGEREGHQEIRSLDAIGQFPLHPSPGGPTPALRAGFVVAGVEGKMPLSTLITVKDPSSQSRRAALGDGANGVALGSRKMRVNVEKIRQEQAQRR